MAFTFPMDTYSRAGAVRVTPDGNNFYTPAVIFGPDGVTAISTSNPLSVQNVVGGSVVSASNPLPTQLTGSNNQVTVLNWPSSQSVSVSNWPSMQNVAITGTSNIQAADGSIASIGSKSDSAITNPTLSASQIALLKGLLAQLQGNGTGSLPIQLAGSTIQVPVDIQNVAQNLPVNIQSVASNLPIALSASNLATFFNVYNTINITDTAVHNLSNSALQLGGYGKKVIEIYSTLNQPVTITFIRNADQPYQMPTYSTGGNGAGGGTVTFKPCSITVPAAPNTSTPVIAMITENDWPILGQPLGEPSNVTAQCSTAPTQGSVTLKLHAWPLC